MRTIVLVLLVCAATLVQAQQGKRPMSLYEQTWAVNEGQQTGGARSFAEVSAGILLPGNSFGSVNANQQSGYAKNGFVVSAGGAVLVYKTLGIGATMAHFTSAVQTNNYLQNTMRQLPAMISGKMQAQNWRNTLLAAGPVIMIPQNRVMLDLYLQAGMLRSNSPEVVFTGSDGESQLLQVQHAAQATALAALGGMRLSYSLLQMYRLRVVAKADFMGATPIFHNRTTTMWNGTEIQTRHQNRQPVGSVALSVGLRYEFERKKHLPDK
ncbi:hypothetical protein C7N43_26865 [Sphingobacteriales bacterium UPWRP_1]|nr:hypothetical protein B6N25_03620 [Sphingobacteriales bacterium TSM_CSS]PSJ73875.1 hypothetical protein C7N43_26865 [Sphingobacteriales bacterium UPWRP_1]